MINLTDILNLWNEFFFSPTPVHTVAVFRIVLGFILLYDAIYNLINIKEFLGPTGLISYDHYIKRSGYAFSLFHYLPPKMWSAYAIVGLHIVALLSMILGFYTTISVILVYLTLCSIVNRNPTICNGGDNISRIMCFLLIFASSGYAYSLDEYFFYSANKINNDYLLRAPWAVRLMQIQLSVIYLKSVYWKLKGHTYRSGIAMYYVVQNNNYKRFSVPSFFLQKPFVYVLTWGALFVEFAIGIGIWISEFRNPLILTGFGLHLAIEYILNVHLFSWFMMAVLVLFIDPYDIVHFINYFTNLIFH
jgi:uncharacterized membrane protein YphA (DoxX/SURF4 family)